ncbi:hypothetical protein [Acetanaerobacterium elongatum]|uniref:Uncharacterized protein n=1 Tax=Acetanaerobacterium elongatum TaxID=258515 RepID=A0A1G9U2X1_9FIRM|nr:hypothetical protein [Acetanaerobacterium elongatum]SDM53974.1 hypothetical protein SAMN05192585_10150 [Acetanaerobacterium elongatum]
MSNETPGYQPPVAPPPPVYNAPVQKPVRRVGVFTMGASLIGAGALTIYAIINPGLDIYQIIRYTPAILILLGIEILVYAIFQKNSHLQYDFLSMFVCFILIVFSLSLAGIPTIFKNWGPNREYTEKRLQNEVYDLCYDKLSAVEKISDVDIHINLERPELEKDMTYRQLTGEDLVNINVTLYNEYPSTEAFTAACRKLLNELTSTRVPFDGVAFTTNGKIRYDLHLEGRYQLAMTAKELEPLVDVTSNEQENASSEVSSASASSNTVSNTSSTTSTTSSTPPTSSTASLAA